MIPELIISVCKNRVLERYTKWFKDKTESQLNFPKKSLFSSVLCIKYNSPDGFLLGDLRIRPDAGLRFAHVRFRSVHANLGQEMERDYTVNAKDSHLFINRMIVPPGSS